MKKNNLYQNLLRTISCVAFVAVGLIMLWQVKVSADEHAQKSNLLQYSNFSETPANSNFLNERAVEISDSPVFAEFDAWVEQYSKVNSANDVEKMQAGEKLALKRQVLLRELIQIDPKSALEHSISTEEYNRLPLFITKNLERRFSAYGDFLVYVLDEENPSTGEMTGSRTEREAVFGNDRYKAVVYGRREAMTSKLDIPLQGIILDDTAVLDESPLRKIEPADYAARDIDSARLGEDGAAAEVGGKPVYFSGESELDDYVREQIEWESKIGPERPSKNLAPEEMASPWTEGQKSVLVIRVDFSDRPGEPVDFNNQPLTVARALNLINNEVNQFYVNSSYGKTSLQATVTPVLRLPQPQTYYSQGSNYLVMLNDARVAARAAGFETNNFNLDIVAFSRVESLGWFGRGYVGAKGQWLNGGFYMTTIAHEFGHNYGLLHANSWRTTDGTVIGQGYNYEDGDAFDQMGFRVGPKERYHFNTRYKRLLDWLTDANVQNVTTDGVYRIFAQDSPAPGGIRALSIRKDNTKSYWVEFRQLFTDDPNVMNGVTIRWDPTVNGLPETQLLDMTPNTESTTDAPLLIGQSFYDNVARIKITVLGKGNTTPESIDIRVEINAMNARSAFDFDGDGKADISVFRPSNGAWYLQQSANGFTGMQFGLSSDKLVPADYDGDGKTDIAVYRGGTWYLMRSQLGFTGYAFGDGNDIPQPADFDGDGKAEIAVYRPSNGNWYVFNLATNQFSAYQFGASTDKPVIGDYDGDNKADYAVYRQSNGTWYLQRSAAGFTGIQFGDSNDKPVPADYDGDGKTDVAVFRPSNGTWYLLRSQLGFTGVQFGISTDLPTPGDYDGDGKADVAVFRSGVWYLNRSTAGFTGVQFGADSDKPVPNAYVP